MYKKNIAYFVLVYLVHAFQKTCPSIPEVNARSLKQIFNKILENKKILELI